MAVPLERLTQPEQRTDEQSRYRQYAELPRLKTTWFGPLPQPVQEDPMDPAGTAD